MSPGDESLPVTDEEFILRRIHKNNYKPAQAPPVLRPAFEPNSTDTDGLSFYRESIISPEELAVTGNKPGEYYIARMSVSELRGGDLRLTIDAAPDPDPNQPRGHCVIRELTIDEHKNRVKEAKAIENRLAKIAARDIVFVPEGCFR